MAEGFINPYNFVPSATRRPEGLGDEEPFGHHTLADDRFSGVITVTMKAVTPLLVPGKIVVDKAGHKTVSTRVDEQGHPLIPSTSVKGMLRSAYEAITNSRFGVYSTSHDEKPSRWVDNGRRKETDTDSAKDVTPEKLLRATDLKMLSAADRVFGWVNDGTAPDRRSTWAGLVSVGPVTAEDKEPAIDTTSFTLQILDSPKSQNVGFYLGQTPKDVSRLTPGKPGAQARTYSKDLTVRGRKIYPHHRAWPGQGVASPKSDRKSDQNSSWTNSIREGATFRFDVTVRNLTTIELGALVYLLQPPDGVHHRFGGAKPLGFGSVVLTIESSTVASGGTWREALRTWSEPVSIDLTDSKNAFVKAMREGKPKLGAVLDAFEAAGRGWDGYAIHYPRRAADAIRDRGFEWFTTNDRAGPNRQVLPLLESGSAPELRYNGTDAGGNNTGNRPHNRQGPNRGNGNRPRR